VIPLGLVAAPASGATNWQIYEKFNYNPSWDGLNNTTSPHNFGYSSTSHTGGGDSLEAGGTITREDNPRAYYAANIGSLSLNDPLKMTGTFNPQTPNSGTIFLGFFNTGNGGYPPSNTLGLHLDGGGGGTDVYTRAINSAGSEQRSSKLTTLSSNTPVNYTLNYNPSANSNNGAITLQFNGGTTFTQNLPSGFKTSGASFNRFGLHNVQVDGASYNAFIDDITYTSSTPKVERFTVDPGWDGHNNRINNPRQIVQSFGFSSGTNNAGGSTGEVGGTITPAGEPAYYAKSITSKTLNDSMTASGKVKVTGKGNTMLGFFYSGTVNEWRTQNSIALRLNGRGDGTFLAYAEYGTDLWRAGSTGDTTFNANQTYDWSLTYNPSGNGGNGQITGVIGTQNLVLNLDSGHKADEGVFNHFGLLNVAKSADDAGQVWIDNVAVNGGSTETFGSNPSWSNHNNSNTYNSNNVRFNFDFGHSSGTNFAGGAAAGEAGGHFFRGDSREAGKMAFYGAELGETLNMEDKLHAEGKIAMRRGVTDSTVHLGFFHDTDSVQVSSAQAISTPENFIGVTIEGPSSEGFFFYPSYNTDTEGTGSGGNRGSTPPRIYPDNDVHTWSLDYDPAGAGGLGLITITLDGNTGTMTLGSGHQDVGALFNRFGFITPHIDGNGQTVYIDDVIWTNARAPSNPEPSAALALLAAGGVLLARRRR
jgi:hypothetical protein